MQGIYNKYVPDSVSTILDCGVATCFALTKQWEKKKGA